MVPQEPDRQAAANRIAPARHDAPASGLLDVTDHATAGHPAEAAPAKLGVSFRA
jgi:hypothetical protein